MFSLDRILWVRCSQLQVDENFPETSKGRKKKLVCPLGPGQGLGCGPPGRGDDYPRPLPCVVDQEDQEGRGIIDSNFWENLVVPNFCYFVTFCDNMAAERTGKKRAAAYFIYIWHSPFNQLIDY